MIFSERMAAMNKLIPANETLTIEFKSDKKGYCDDDLIDEIVGMANTKGGILYLGVEDDGEITGISEKHSDEIGLMALVANKTVPSLSVRAELISVNYKAVMAIEVPMSRAIVAASDGKVLRRRLKLDGTPENIPMYPYEIPGRLSELSLLDVTSQPVDRADYNDLDPQERRRLRHIIRNRNGEKDLLELNDEELDKALRLAVDLNGKLVPTLAGMLLIGREDKIRELVPTMRADFQVLEGTAVRVNQSFHECLLSVVTKFEEYLKPWNPEHEMEYGLFRIPVPEFSGRAFREGIVNAFSHRDYSLLGSVRVEITQEGLSITNPGGFIDGVNLKNLLTVEPHGRNPALADALKRIGLAEKTGRGIDRIYEGSIVYGRQLPDYSESTERSVRLFIPRSAPDLAFSKMIADEQNKIGHPLSITWLMILFALKEEKRMNVPRIASSVNIPESKVRVSMEQMLERGLIEAYGNGNNRTYTLGKRIYAERDKSVEYVRQTDIEKVRYPELVMKLAKQQNGIVCKQDVVELIHVTPSQAYAILRKLVAEGKLSSSGTGRYAYYQINK